MAVDALQLRPRGVVALFDAAARICGTSSGVWALTLPAGAALVASLFNLAEAMRFGRELTEPVAWWTLAWGFRAVSQGAASWFLEAQILKEQEPSLPAAFGAALKRTPSLLVAAAHNAVLNTVLALFTLSIGFLFAGAHTVAYAVAMRGEGSALGVYATCSRLLGAARQTAALVKLAGVTQVILALNVHLGVGMAVYFGTALLGLDLTFVDRFTSLDNPVWLATVAMISWALFEPLRAAVATLLLVDGRVRQEGLDLVAAVEQLPRRRRSRASSVAALLALALVPAGARAEPSELHERAARLTDSCQMRSVPPAALDDLDRLPSHDSGAAARFMSRVERRAYDESDCATAEADLREGLRLLHEARAQEKTSDARTAQGDVKAILARPEFKGSRQADPEVKEEKKDDPPGWFSKWWSDLWDSIFDWLRNSKHERTPDSNVDLSGGSGVPGAGLVVVFAIVLAVIIVAAVFLLSGRRKGSNADEEPSSLLSQSALSQDPMSAVSKAPETWAGLADELARRGEFREAIRHLYLALLSRLHRDGAIDYDPTFSNWDYLRGFKGPGEWLGRFRDLTRRFDFAWYGNVDVTQLAYSSFRVTVEPLLSAPAPEAS